MNDTWVNKTLRQELPEINAVEGALYGAFAALDNEIQAGLKVHDKVYGHDDGCMEAANEMHKRSENLVKLALSSPYYAGIEAQVASNKEAFVEWFQETKRCLEDRRDLRELNENDLKFLNSPSSLYNAEYAGQLYDKTWAAMKGVIAKTRGEQVGADGPN